MSLRDYLTGILAVPLTDREVTRVLAGWNNQTRSAAFQDWLINTRQLHSTLSYEVRSHAARPEWMFLEIEHPFKVSVGFRFVEQSELLTSEGSLPATIQRESLERKLDLTVCALCADETQPGVKEAIDACWQSSRSFGNQLMLMEPAWLAGIVVEQIRPILQGETLGNSTLTASSFYERTKGGLAEKISVPRVKNRFQAVLDTVTDEPGTFVRKWRELRKEDIFAGPILLCTTLLPPVTYSSDAVVRFHKSLGATEETCALLREKVEWEKEVWRKHITQYERYDIVDRGLVEEYFAAPEYHQMPLTVRELQEQVSNLLELLKYDNYNLCLTPEAVDISYEIRGHEVRVRTDRRNKGQPRPGRISGVTLGEQQMADVFEREFWSIYRLSETEFKNKEYVASWLKSLAKKYRANGQAVGGL